MFIGKATAKIDKWGRIRIPSNFLKTFKEKFGNEVFVTSTDDRNLQIYRLAAWFELVDNLHKGKRDDLLLREFLIKTNYNGSKARVDKYGRVQIPGFINEENRAGRRDND
jgi:DNA-binding transcriptional regulator/RsmH inhibitor MraZ